MSDLQCAARILLASGLDESATEWLTGERVALVYDAADGSDVPDDGAAAVLSRALGVAVRRTDRPLQVPDALAGRAEVLEQLRPVADLHRGETVVLLGPGLGHAEVHELLLDGDGSVVRRLR